MCVCGGGRESKGVNRQRGSVTERVIYRVFQWLGFIQADLKFSMTKVDLYRQHVEKVQPSVTEKSINGIVAW